jgi:hypothetical protein
MNPAYVVASRIPIRLLAANAKLNVDYFSVVLLIKRTDAYYIKCVLKDCISNLEIKIFCGTLTLSSKYQLAQISDPP